MNRTTLLLIVGASTLLLAPPASSAEDFDIEALREERAEQQDRYFIRGLTVKRLNTAIKLIDAEQYEEAIDKLGRLNPERLNALERSSVYRYMAKAAMSQGDAARAIGYFEQVIEQEAILVDDEAGVRFNIVQLYASLENWEKVDEELSEWFHYVDEPNGRAYYLLAISRYQRDLYAEALVPAIQALEISDKPKEGWLKLAAALYLQEEDFDSAVPILEELVVRYTKKQYWVQLSLIYGARGDYPHALRVQQLAYSQGLLTTDDELRRLARSYLFRELPYPAARVLERGINDGQIVADEDVLELLGNAWIAAREYEKSIEPLERAANLADDGRLYLRLGQVRVQREDWDEATELIQLAIEKGGLADVGKAHMLLGISYYGVDNRVRARTAFRRARVHESTEKEANVWLEHIARQGGES